MFNYYTTSCQNNSKNFSSSWLCNFEPNLVHTDQKGTFFVKMTKAILPSATSYHKTSKNPQRVNHET